MDLKVKVEGRIQKPLKEVFDAVYNNKKLAGYFITGGGSAPLEANTTVMWDFADFPGAFPVEVKDVIKNEKIVIQWGATHPKKDGSPYNTTVEFTFKELSESNTLVTITESGWEDSEHGYMDSRGNTGGWMNMLTCMKAYVEHGINLRQGMFK